MVKLLSVVLSPLYILGFVIGFIVKPFINGLTDGLFFIEVRQAKKYLKRIRELGMKKIFENQKK